MVLGTASVATRVNISQLNVKITGRIQVPIKMFVVVTTNV